MEIKWLLHYAYKRTYLVFNLEPRKAHFGTFTMKRSY